MKFLLIHILAGLAIYPVSLLYWFLYWHVQPSDPNSLKLGSDVVTGQTLTKKAYRIKYLGYFGACIIVIVWLLIGNYYAKGMFYVDLLALFHWSDSKLHAYLYFWFCVVVGIISLAWYTAKILVSREKAR